MTIRHFAQAAATLAFTLFAACSNSQHGPLNIAPMPGQPATPEFHDAHIGGDALRDRIDGE